MSKRNKFFCDRKCRKEFISGEGAIEHSLKMSSYRIGKKMSEKSIEKISQYMKGKRHALGTKMEKSHLWKGDKAKYVSIHCWVLNNYGRPLKCEVCGKEGGSSRLYNWSNKDHKYKRAREDWQRLCASCHKKYDLEKGLVKH